MEEDYCKFIAKQQRKRLMLDPGFDTSYWTALREIAEKELEATLLSKEILIAEIKENAKDRKEAFRESKLERRKLVLRERVLRLHIKLYEAQTEKMRSKEEKFNLRRPYLQLFMGGSSGLGNTNTKGQRDDTLQSAFRSNLILKMGSKHPLSNCTDLWCPIRRDYFPDGCLVASHLFPWKCGETTMEAIFGCPDSGRSELFKAENGILWSKGAGRRFEAGYFMIVPDVPDEPTEQQLDAWEASDPREYKIRVLNPKAKLMREKLYSRGITWADLDNERLQLLTRFRPRAKYLYFAYCVAMLWQSLRRNHPNDSSVGLRKHAWGVAGKYIPEGMLLGFVESMGREYENLLEGAIKEEGAVVDTTALAAASAHIKEMLKRDLGGEDSDCDEDSDDEEEDTDGEDDSDQEEEEEFYLSTLFDEARPVIRWAYP